jgi:lipid II:glycine glycyltransferase (peptidoglycan interpeptide bridge formation enzyme)
MSTPVSWQIEVDRSKPLEWAQLLDLFDDANLYQTWSYGAVHWGEKNLSHLVLKRNGEVLGMAQLRIVRPTNLRFGIAYLRWGPLCHRRGAQLDPEATMRMASSLEEEYVCKRRLFLKILPNAFVGSPRGEMLKSCFSKFNSEPRTLTNTYRTFILDLNPSLEDLRGNLDAKWRNKLSGSERNGLRVVAGGGPEDYRTFCGMYKQMRSRKKFESTVDIEEFGRIQDDLSATHRMRILICVQEGMPVAGLVTSAMGDSAIYLLGATADGGLNSKGAYLLQWSHIEWLKENGYKWYDLGGIDPERNPGVYQFKKGLSGRDVSHLTPFVACKNLMSSAIMRASLAMQNTARSVCALQLGCFLT